MDKVWDGHDDFMRVWEAIQQVTPERAELAPVIDLRTRERIS